MFDKFVWIAQWTLAILIFLFGLIKLFHKFDTPKLNRQAYFSGLFSCLIGIGLIFPVFTKAYPFVVPLSATVAFLMQLYGIFISKEKPKTSSIITHIVVLLLLGAIIYARYIDWGMINK